MEAQNSLNITEYGSAWYKKEVRHNYKSPFLTLSYSEDQKKQNH